MVDIRGWFWHAFFRMEAHFTTGCSKVAKATYNAKVVFCDRFIDKCSRTHVQMVQAARNGVHNIIEGSGAATS